MSTPFQTKIRSALANPALQEALDGNYARRLIAREVAFSSLEEDLQILRQRAHALRERTIANLDQYLEQFITQAQANGIVIHRAANSAEACQVVCDILRQHQARLVVKSKTMVGEEIEINHAMQAEGIQVVETDLGEYIVQLRGERPGHILTPAVHLRRSDVARTFEEKIGLPYTEDIPTMTNAARRNLRQAFLTADAGISGVNLGVAENGVLCLVTNEGNGRMVTTLPKVHIALMGIERLVPTMDDLALILSLLARSGSGQKISVYTSLLKGPRQPGELDGPRERHLVLLDNGRNAIRDSPLAEILCCIRCGTCLNACPVFREIGGHAYVGAHGQPTPYSGPLGSVLSPALFGQAEFSHLAHASSLCGACKEACPIDIDLPGLLLRVRAGYPAPVGQASLPAAQISTSTGQASAPAQPGAISTALATGLRLFTWAAGTSGRFSATQRLAGFFSRLAAPFSEWMRLPAFTGWGYSRDFPRPALQPFRSRFAKIVANQNTLPAKQPDPPSQPIASVPIPPIDKQSLVERFAAELTALGGNFTPCTASQLPGVIFALLQAHKIDALQAWGLPEEAIETARTVPALPGELLPALQAAGIHISNVPDPDLKAGLTGAVLGVAETGTLILTSNPSQPMTASLLPEIHLVVLHASQVVARLKEAFQRPELSQAGNAVLISGPSRTADIEMTLTIGVHGPGEVHVFCIE